MVTLEKQIEKGRQLISRGKSLGKDTSTLEERVRTLEAQLEEYRTKNRERMSDSSIIEESKEVIRDGFDPSPNEKIYLEPNDHTNGTSRLNTKHVEVEINYRNGNLQIEAPNIKSLFRDIKRKFPTGSIVLHDGAIYVAFYYLPVLLKVLEQSFGSIGADSDIPDLEGVRRFLHLWVVNLEVALAAEMDNPVTKLLLKQKSPDEVAEITRELKTELRRSLWVDSVWDAVRKSAPLSEEKSNGEELGANAQSIVDKGLAENTNFFQDESQMLQKYNEKGGNKEMGFIINVEDVIEAGVYEARISGVETKEGKFGPVLVVTFKLDDGRLLDSLFPFPAKVGNRTGLLIKKALGEIKHLDSDALIGKKVKIFVEHVERNGHTYANVTKIL